MIWLLVTLFYIGFIFSNSMEPGDASSQKSSSVLEFATRFFDSVGLGGLGITEYGIRKLAHFGEYTLLGILLTQTVRSFGLISVKGWSCAFFSGVLTASADECIQLFVSGRSGRLSDVVLDSFGIAFGLLLVALLFRIRKREDKKC